MSLDHLDAPKKKRTCVACKAFVAECNAPVGEGSAAMCWLCAHHVVDHGTPVHEAAEARCECTPDMIYPQRVLQERCVTGVMLKKLGHMPLAAIRMKHGDLTYEQIRERLETEGERGYMYNPVTGQIEPFHIPPSGRPDRSRKH